MTKSSPHNPPPALPPRRSRITGAYSVAAKGEAAWKEELKARPTRKKPSLPFIAFTKETSK